MRTSHAQQRINNYLHLLFSHKMKQVAIVNVVVFGFLIFPSSYQNEDSCESFSRQCSRVAALIPARAGSKGIKNKNLSVLGNDTLLSRTLKIVNEFGQFDSVWVLTDGEAIANEGTKQGANIHWRDPKTATDTAPTVSAVNDFLMKQKGYDIVAVIQCTSPFLKTQYLATALGIILKNDTDCVFSVTRNFHLRWNENNGGFVFPINFHPKNRPRRQDWKGEVVENGMFYFVKSKLVLEDQVLQNDRCKTVEIPREFSLEIDTKTDLELARVLLPLLNKYPEEG